MKSLGELTSQVRSILKDQWDTRTGEVVPETKDLRLGNNAVELEATILYADMADSTSLATKYKSWFAAAIYKSYLHCACELIKNNDGVITSFDGDRVMAVYIGKSKNTNAVKTALQINHVIKKVINLEIASCYPDVPFRLEQAVGVDTGKVFVARTGVWGDNDLVWVGRSPNLAAKLCTLREGSYASFITEEVYSNMNSSTKLSDDRNMWESFVWREFGTTIYRSSWTWAPS